MVCPYVVLSNVEVIFRDGWRHLTDAKFDAPSTKLIHRNASFEVVLLGTTLLVPRSYQAAILEKTMSDGDAPATTHIDGLDSGRLPPFRALQSSGRNPYETHEALDNRLRDCIRGLSELVLLALEEMPDTSLLLQEFDPWLQFVRLNEFPTQQLSLPHQRQLVSQIHLLCRSLFHLIHEAVQDNSPHQESMDIARRGRRFTEAQLRALESWYQANLENPYLLSKALSYLEELTGLRADQIRNWVSNRRRRARTAHTSNELRDLLGE